MQNLLKEIYRELLYQWFSKLIISVIVIVGILSIINIYSLNHGIYNKYSLFRQTLEQYENDGVDIESKLKEDYEIKIINENNEEIDNALRYDYEQVKIAINAITPCNTINNILSYLTFVYFPIIFGIYGVLVGTYDYKNKTLKLKSILSNYKEIFLSKQISIIITVMITIMTSIIISYIGHWIAYNAIINANELGEFISDSRNIFYNPIKQVLFSLIVSIIFSNIGFILGCITKNVLMSSLIIVIYNIMIPSLGKYDLTNLIANIGSRLFQFNSLFTLFKPKEVANYAYIVLIIVVIIINICCYWVLKKRSKYS